MAFISAKRHHTASGPLQGPQGPSVRKRTLRKASEGHLGGREACSTALPEHVTSTADLRYKFDILQRPRREGVVAI
jgi:hypothetical protein